MSARKGILDTVVNQVGAGVLAVLPATVVVVLIGALDTAPGAAGPWWKAPVALLVWSLCIAVALALLRYLFGGRFESERWLSWVAVGGVVSVLAVRSAGGGWLATFASAVAAMVVGAAADRVATDVGGSTTRALALAAVAVVGLATVWERLDSGPTSLQAPRRIILICVDTLRADHVNLGPSGRQTTPALAALAGEEGFAFDSAYASSSWTLPSVASLMTSLHPPEHGAEDREQRLDPEAFTLARQLSGAGWLTSGFAVHIYASSLFGIDVGFHEFRDLSIDWSFGEGGQLRADAVNRVILPWLAHHAETPFFLFVHLFDPHWDYDPPPPYERRFTDPAYRGPATGRWDYLRQFLPADVSMPEADLRHVKGLYDGEVAWTDSQLDVMFGALRALGLWQDTLLVIMSDHGEEFQEHGSVHHIRTLYEEVLRVPLIVKLPGGRPAWARPRISERVRVIDIAPTILELAGAPPLPDARGTSLAPLLGTPGADRDVFAHTIRHDSYKAALIRGSRKAIVGYPPGAETLEVYDLAVDPGERAPVMPTPDTAAQIRAEVLAMVNTMRAERKRGTTEPVVLSPAQLEHLERLGYVDRDDSEQTANDQ